MVFIRSGTCLYTFSFASSGGHALMPVGTLCIVLRYEIKGSHASRSFDLFDNELFVPVFRTVFFGDAMAHLHPD